LQQKVTHKGSILTAPRGLNSALHASGTTHHIQRIGES
jgi:hypothetical protein